MKRRLAVIAFALYFSVSASSQSLTVADRDRAMKYLETTKQGVLDATAGLSEAQWNFKAGPDRWSIAEVTEHIATAEGYLRTMIIEQVMKAPPRPDGDSVEAIDEMVVTMVPDRTQKSQAPEPLKPANRYGSPEGSLKAFKIGRASC